MKFLDAHGLKISSKKCLTSDCFTGAKLEHMIALRDEVELEYADRMEELRDMYRNEMDSQNEKYEAEKAKMRMLESSLQVHLCYRKFYSNSLIWTFEHLNIWICFKK